MKKPALLLIAGVLLIALGALWLTLGQSERGERGAAGKAPAATAAEPGALEVAAPVALTAAEAPPVVAPASESAEREARPSDGSGRRIAGAVRWPAGAPADDTLRVVALSADHPAREIYGASGALLALSEGKAVEGKTGEARTKDAVLGTAPVRADGSFELALGTPADVWLAVDGRFLYSARALPVPAGTASAELATELGGCLAGRVRLPGDAAEAATLAKLDVELGPDGQSFSMGSVASAPLFRRVARLDAEGRFELRALPAGHEHALEVDSDAYADQEIKGLTFEPGVVREVEVALLVGATLSGRVVDESGAPLAGAEVDAAESAVWGFTGEEMAKGETDASGAFVLEHVAPGKCLLLAKKDGYLESEPEKLELADGESRAGFVLQLGHGATIAGRVSLPDGSPCEGASVKVSFDPEALVGMGAFNAARGASGESKSAADGRFAVAGLGKGPFQVTASLERKAADDAKETWKGRAKAVKPDTLDLELSLGAPLVLRGRVRDAAGAPIPEFRVVAAAASGAWFQSGESRVEEAQDPEGDFVVRGLEAGKWQVEARAAGFGPMTAVEVTLPRAEEEPLELVLTPAATIAGKVVDPKGVGVSGARVTLQVDAAQRMQGMRGDLQLPEATSGEDGEFLLSGLASGTSAIYASHEGFAASEPASVAASAEQPASGVILKLRKGALLTGEVFGKDTKPAAGVQILAQGSGGLEMNMRRADAAGAFRFEALSPGPWTITAILEGGEVETQGSSAEASASFLENMRFTMVELEDGEEEHVVLGAPPKDPVLVRGRVRHGERPLSEGVVSFVGEGSKGLEGFKIAQLGPDGRYQTELGAPGKYVVTVQITAGGGAFQQNNVEYRETIPEKAEHVLDIELPLGALRGLVVGPDRNALKGARVTLATDGGLESGSMLGGQYSEATTDDAGRYAFDFLRPGTYSVAAGGALFGGAFGGQSQAGRVVRAGLEVAEGRALEGVDFQLEAPGDIQGRVLDAGGTPLKDASVFVRDANGRLLDRLSMTTSGADGAFTYKGVAPGEYVVSARAKGAASGESAPVRVESGGSASVELVLQAGTKLVVEVVDEEGNALRVRVSVTDEHGREMQGMLGFSEMAGGISEGFDSSRTNVGPLPPGTYTVTATAEDGKKASRPVNLEGQPERRLKLRLR
jgi:protocatechuate 3,4-dioxygenase beta subunit